MEDTWVRAARRVDCVEREVRSKKAKIDDMSYVFQTAFGRVQNKVFYYPVEYGHSRYTMSQGLVIDIMDQEISDAFHRGWFPWDV